MPTYTYKREDGTTFEIEQRITEDPLKTCPTTGQAVKRIITGGAGLVFKGSGFYLTDYARGTSAASTGDNSKSSDDSGSKSDSTAKSDTSASKSSDSKSSDSKKS